MKKPDKHWIERGNNSLCQGFPGTNSKRHTCYPSNYPSHVVRGEGPYVYDAWGNRYLDFVCGLGCLLLGHNHPKVVEAVQKQVVNGCSYSLPHVLEIEVAEKIQEMFPQIDKVRFLKTGNEGTLAAVRIARSYSGLNWVYSEGYHGWGDLWTSMTLPACGVEDDFKISSASDKYDLGTYICEPVALDASEERKAVLKENIERYKVTIFDEVVTGLRVPKFSVGRWWDLTPSITVLGKAIASGYPLSVVAGKEDVMDCDYFVSSTYSGDAVSLAACKATLEEVQKKGTEDLLYYSKRFQDHFNKICEPIGVNITGYGSRGQINLYEEPNAALLLQEMCKAGVMFGRAFFFSHSHLEANIEDTVMNLLNDVVTKIQNGKVKL
jgi:glutamate-1-semialdehyde 2,1-aminomutase